MRTLPSILATLALGTAYASVPELVPDTRALPPMQRDTQCLPRSVEPTPLYRASAPVPAAAPAYGRARGGYGAGAVSGGVVADKATAMPPSPPAPLREAVVTAQSAGPAHEERVASTPAVSSKASEFEAQPQMERGVVSDGWAANTQFGGTIQLSNDDAMSLTSAQRLLWALEHDAPIPSEHIRPHELLNYFSFSADKPAPDAMIAVQPSAYREGDVLKLALNVSVASPARGPLDLTLVIDRSGSMQGENRIAYVRRALHQTAEHLRAGDRVDIVLFDHVACTALRDFVIGRDPASTLSELIDNIQPRGSTDLNAGLQIGYDLAREHRTTAGNARSGRVMVFTDARLNTGTVDPNIVSEVGKAFVDDNIRLTGVGVGSDFRDDVLDMLTEKGRGAYVFLGSDRVVDRLFSQGFEALVHTVANDARFALSLPDSLGLVRFYGEESSRDPENVTPVNLEAGSHQAFFQELQIRDGVLQSDARVSFEASWTDPETGARAGRTFQWRVRDLLAAGDRDARKASALMAWSDLLLERAMSGERCGSAWQAYRRDAQRVAGDAELAWITQITADGCETSPAEPEIARAGRTKVRVDADQWISGVTLACADGAHDSALGSGENVVAFEGLAAGECTVTLHGSVPLRAAVQVASTGSEIDCRVRAGRVVCD